jgi:hypothetical protein
MSVIEQAQPRGIFYDRTDPALMLSTGNPPKPGQRSGHPTRLPFFRAKPGGDGRWSGAAKAFNDFYGCEIEQLASPDGPVWMAKSGPKQVVIRFPSDSIPDVFDVRYLAFAKGRLAAKGDTNYAAVAPWQHYEPETITAYPIEGDAVRFKISGPDDPLCAGGSFDIPTEKDGKNTLVVRATLGFTLAEIGALSAVTQYQTASVAVRSGLWKALQQFATLGPLSSWLFLLRVVPGSVKYRDKDGVNHKSKVYNVQLWGPIHGLDKREAITIADAQHMVDQARARQIAAGGVPLLDSGIHPASPGQTASGVPPVLESGGWAVDDTNEPVEGEVVNPDDDIPFGDDDGPGL